MLGVTKVDAFAVQRERLDQRRQQAFCKALRIVLLAVLEEHGEFVAAQAVGLVRLSQGAAHALGDGLQEGVADIVAEAVVDLLEAVQVQVQQRQFASAGAGAKQRLAELFVEGLAVAQAGQRVAVGHFQQLLLVGDLVADVADDAAVAP